MNKWRAAAKTRHYSGLSKGVRRALSGRFASSDMFRDEAGFTTVGVVLALLITLSLIFTSAQVYQVTSAAADVQDVADAAALAAQNEVAEFMIVARVCDAVVLSLSLTGIVTAGLGVAALCTPVTAKASETLLKAARDIIKARDTFAEKAAAGLNQLQKALPFFAAASAASIAAANNGGPGNATYVGLAMLVPTEGKEISIDLADGAGDLFDQIETQGDSIKAAAEAAEKAAQEADAWKQQAFQRDCGDNPSYCMYERAVVLAGLKGAENPLYSSVDTWSFSVALERARIYYSYRLSHESPEDSSVAEQARSALRQRFYQHAVDRVAQGYVRETKDSFDAYFPHLPKNTSEMRTTVLYTEAIYPAASNEEGNLVVHAWPGCPEAAGAGSFESIASMDQRDAPECSQCEFSASSMGKVAAASTSIENGFEYHYEAVAQAADAYQKARENFEPQASEVKDKAKGLFDQCLLVLKRLGGLRIEASPPGRFGVIAFVVNTSAMPASTGFVSGFVQEAGSLGTRAAVSGATLVDESSSEGRNILSSLLDGWKEKGGALSGVLGVVLDCWGGLLNAYLDGQESIEKAIKQATDAIPFASASGLGSWAAEAFGQAVEALGLQPAKLEALKPVLVNSAHVSAADTTAFAARFLSVKQQVISRPLSSGDAFTSAVSAAEAAAMDAVAQFEGSIEIASIEFLGEGGPSIPLTVALPPAVKDVAVGFISDAANTVRSVYAQVVGVRVWE